MTAHQDPSALPGNRGSSSPARDSLRPPSSFRLSYWMARDLFILAELGLIVVSSLVAKGLYLGIFHASQQTSPRYATAGVLCAIVAAVIFKSYGLYGRGELFEGKSDRVRLVLATSFAFMVLLTAAYVTKTSDDFSRGWLIVWYALSCVSVIGARHAFRPAYEWLVGRRVITHRVAIVGDAAASQRLLAEFKGSPDIELAGFFAGDAQPTRESIAELVRTGQQGLIDEIVVVLAQQDARDYARIVDELGVLPVDILLYTDQIPAGAEICEVRRIGQLSLLGVTAKPVREWGHVVKLVEDYVIAGIALVLLAPVMAGIAVAIKLDTPGPVFFRQRRHGYNHRVIKVFKFRTMTVLEDGETVKQAVANDKRVTGVGAFLRRTSLDELPQLFNVMMGEMSLVGPRPHALAHNDHYSKIIEGYAHRHRMKPGITGLAQIKGFRGPTTDPELMRQRMQHDLDYIEKWSFWLDMEILVKTVSAVIKQRNAH